MNSKKSDKPTCELCKKTLVSIGSSRSNGKCHNDWTTRKYHKKCFQLVESQKEMIKRMKQFNLLK